MFSNWMKFSLSTARLGYEVQTVVALRMLKLARGGKAAESEARRMVAEKGVAFAEAATTLATGGSMNKVVRRVRSRVNKNKRRLSTRYAKHGLRYPAFFSGSDFSCAFLSSKSPASVSHDLADRLV